MNLDFLVPSIRSAMIQLKNFVDLSYVVNNIATPSYVLFDKSLYSDLLQAIHLAGEVYANRPGINSRFLSKCEIFKFKMRTYSLCLSRRFYSTLYSVYVSHHGMTNPYLISINIRHQRAVVAVSRS